eukprot:5599760-Pyramimonas_sp.AAC.1
MHVRSRIALALFNGTSVVSVPRPMSAVRSKTRAKCGSRFCLSCAANLTPEPLGRRPSGTSTWH